MVTMDYSQACVEACDLKDAQAARGGNPIQPTHIDLFCHVRDLIFDLSGFRDAWKPMCVSVHIEAHLDEI